ncbi:MAG: Holliday junction branch migration protein RuvA [Candidatus Wallbacteria bacterium]|nr:Holliday junction branch migration protein RuvA [Candidatus Wallbacteria bacterium]
MIALVHGQIVEKTPAGVIVDAQGVGYEICVPTSVLAKIGEPGDLVRLRTFLEVKEDSLTLYGFLERAELEIFRLLTSVSGIGPRIAMSVLSSMTPQQVLEALTRDDASAFGRVRGIGKKLASKLVFELREKVTNLPASLPPTVGARAAGVWSEVSEALRSLGYKDLEISESLNWVGKELPAEQASDVTLVLKKALAYFQMPAAR